MWTYANRTRTVETSEITASSLRKSWCTVAHMNDLPSLKLASVARIYLFSIDLWKSDNGSLSQRNNLMIIVHLNFWTTESLISESTRSVSESAGLIRKYLEQPAFEGSTITFVFSKAFLKAFVRVSLRCFENWGVHSGGHSQELKVWSHLIRNLYICTTV